MKQSSIQWCDSTINPAPGCDGCEMWPSPGNILNALNRELYLDEAGITFVRDVLQLYDCASDIYKARHAVAKIIVAADLAKQSHTGSTRKVADIIASQFRCYAGHLHLRYGGVTRGYAPKFEQVTRFPGRMAKAAAWNDLAGTRRDDKPWIKGLPRLIFVSDMGDLLSQAIDFEFIHSEVITAATSERGRHHIWLWLTKRPARMAKFSAWLGQRGVAWPSNLVAMTSVTSQRTAWRVQKLRGVASNLRGLSVEPLWEKVDLDLEGIDWVIVGGESGPAAKPFDLTWCRHLQSQCEKRDIAFFVKQLGHRPVENGKQLKLIDRHGGNWDEWPDDLRIRQFPNAFTTLQ